MRVVVAGGTGFIGTHLVAALRQRGYEVTVLTRRQPRGSSPQPGVDYREWQPDQPHGNPAWQVAVDGAQAVINLAGASIGEGRWTVARKEQMLKSRLAATGALAAAIGRAERKPGVLVSASGKDIYGPRDDEPVDEATPPGPGYLAAVCRRWEEAAREAAAAGGGATRLVIMRLAMVLGRTGGALPRILLPFRLMMGGPLGSGHQYWSWIHIDDATGLFTWALENPNLDGPYNAAAPQALTNREFSRIAGRVLARPAWVPAPGSALRLLLGEMAGPLLLEGQRVVPRRVLDAGYSFRYPELEPALRHILAG